MQNDVIGIAGNDPRKGVLLSLADGIGTGEPAGMAANAAISAIRADYEHNRPDRELRVQVLADRAAAPAAGRSSLPTAAGCVAWPSPATAPVLPVLRVRRCGCRVS